MLPDGRAVTWWPRLLRETGLEKGFQAARKRVWPWSFWEWGTVRLGQLRTDLNTRTDPRPRTAASGESSGGQ